MNTPIILGVFALFERGHFDEDTKAEALRTMCLAAQDAHKEVAVELKSHTIEMGLCEDGYMPFLWRTHSLVFGDGSQARASLGRTISHYNLI